MFNIVDELRKKARAEAKTRLVGPAYGDPDAKPEDQLEWMAADELERLRDAIRAALHVEEHGYSGQSTAEILRAALQSEEDADGRDT